jgi:hypothetical protein
MDPLKIINIYFKSNKIYMTKYIPTSYRQVTTSKLSLNQLQDQPEIKSSLENFLSSKQCFFSAVTLHVPNNVNPLTSFVYSMNMGQEFLSTASIYDYGTNYTIYNVCVPEHQRGHGYAAALLKQVLSDTPKTKPIQLYLEPENPSFDAALKSYVQLGFCSPKIILRIPYVPNQISSIMVSPKIVLEHQMTPDVSCIEEAKRLQKVLVQPLSTTLINSLQQKTLSVEEINYLQNNYYYVYYCSSVLGVLNYLSFFPDWCVPKLPPHQNSSSCWDVIEDIEKINLSYQDTKVVKNLVQCNQPFFASPFLSGSQLGVLLSVNTPKVYPKICVVLIQEGVDISCLMDALQGFDVIPMICTKHSLLLVTSYFMENQFWKFEKLNEYIEFIKLYEKNLFYKYVINQIPNIPTPKLKMETK